MLTMVALAMLTLGGFFDQLAEELHAVMMREIASRDDLHLSDAGLTILLVADEDASPGRPAFSARMVRATRTPSPAAPEPPEAPEAPDAPARFDAPGPAAPPEAPGAPARSDAPGPAAPPEALAPRVVADTPAADDPTRDVKTLMASRDLETIVLDAPPLEAWCVLIDGRPAVPVVDEIVVGRGDTAAIRIDRTDVSRAHARLTVLDDHVTLVDLNSTNGTWVNGQPIQMALLEPGDEIRFGSEVVARLERGQAA